MLCVNWWTTLLARSFSTFPPITHKPHQLEEPPEWEKPFFLLTEILTNNLISFILRTSNWLKKRMEITLSTLWKWWTEPFQWQVKSIQRIPFSKHSLRNLWLLVNIYSGLLNKTPIVALFIAWGKMLQLMKLIINHKEKRVLIWSNPH